MIEHYGDPRLIADRVADVRRELGSAIVTSNNPRLMQLWPVWDLRFNEIREKGLIRPEVPIALIGGTGSGKSTLINALVGAKILPTANNRPCTSAVTEIAYSDGPEYELTVGFMTREQWRRELDLLASELAEPEAGDEPIDSCGEIRRGALDKTAAVYGLDHRKSLTPDRVRQLVEPPSINRCFEMRTGRFVSEDVDQFAKALARYIDSRQRYWPIVQIVRIKGPFPALECGAKLIDLPGLNDPNQAREDVTRRWLKSAHYVWVVFNIKRAMTADLLQTLRSRDFHRNLVLDGREGALTFVATATDAIDTESSRQELGLPDAATDAEVIAANNAEAREYIIEQVDALAEDFRAMAGGRDDRVEAVLARLRQSEVFTASAREFLRLAGLARSRAMGLETLESTEIPALREHLDALSETDGIRAHIRDHLGRIDAIRREVEEEIQAQIVQQNGLREEMEEAITKARGFLTRDLDHLKSRARGDLEASESILAERMERSVERGQAALGEVLNRVSTMHWASLRHMMARGGKYGTLDLSADIARPVLDSIAFAWSDYFGERLTQLLWRTTDSLLRVADDHRRTLLATVGQFGLPDDRWYDDLKRLFETAEKILAEQTAQARGEIVQKIDKDRRTLYEGITRQVRDNMAPAFEKAGKVKGSGTKDKILEILDEHARLVATAMFQDVEQDLLQRVRGLNDWLNRKFAEMAETVLRHSSLAGENLREDARATGADEEDRSGLIQLRDLVSSLAVDSQVA